MLGTPQYLAPEQARGEADHRSDIYALGVMLFEMAAGRPPFIGENAIDVVSQHMTEPPPKLSTCAKGVSPELDALVDSMLAKEPADRPSLLRIRSEIEGLVGNRASKQKIVNTGMRQTLSVRQRSTRFAFLIAGLVGALAMLLAFFLVRSAKSEPEPKREEPKQEARPEPKREPPKREEPRKVEEPPKPPPVAPVVQKGTLVIEWKGTGVVKFSVNGQPATANANLELEPGTYKLATLRNKRTENQDVVIKAGDITRVPIKATTRAPSGGTEDLDPLNNAPR